MSLTTSDGTALVGCGFLAAGFIIMACVAFYVDPAYGWALVGAGLAWFGWRVLAAA